MTLLRRIRGILGLGVVFALGWGAIGGVMEMLANVMPPGAWIHEVDMWPQTLAIPGFLCGIATGIVLALTEGRRRFEQLSVGRFAAWGAVGGVLLGAIGLANGLGGPITNVLLRAAVVLTPLAILGATSAAGTLAIARKGEDRALQRAGDRMDEIGLSDAERRELLGRGK